MKQAIFRFFKVYFGFSRRESRGFLLVFPGLVLLFLLPNFFNHLFYTAEKERYARYLEEARAVADKLQSESELQASVPSVGSGRSGVRSVSQDTLKPAGKRLTKPGRPELRVVDFHEADSILLQAVVGVGPVISSRIVKYRDRLGGFHDPGQLLEVFGVTEELAEKVFEMFPFSPLVYRRLPVNELSSKELAQHPYIGLNEARVIFAYRNQHGKLTGKADLLNIKILTEEWVERIAPYLEF